jgi:hypothetical protein
MMEHIHPQEDEFDLNSVEFYIDHLFVTSYRR